MQATKDQEIIQKLDKPGAGIPLPAKLFLRAYVKPFVVQKASWAECEQTFLMAHGKLKREFEGLSSEAYSKKVLVPKQRGLEDSSRYWSVAMTARHLTIVGQAIEQVIINLSKNNGENKFVDTAMVKPEDSHNNFAAITEYIQFADSFVERIQKNVQDRTSKLTHLHPWFGPLNAKGWMWIMGMHSLIHLKQIKNIKKGLTN